MQSDGKRQSFSLFMAITVISSTPNSSVTLSRSSKYGSSYTLSSSNKAKGRLNDKFRGEHFINKLLKRYKNPLLVHGVSGFPGRICIVRRRLFKKRITGYLQLPMYSSAPQMLSSSAQVLTVFVFTAQFQHQRKPAPRLRIQLSF